MKGATMQRSPAARWLAAVLLGILATTLTACGADEPTGDELKSKLEMSVQADEKDTPKTASLSCPGEKAKDRDICAALDVVAPKVFEPVPSTRPAPPSTAAPARPRSPAPTRTSPSRRCSPRRTAARSPAGTRSGPCSRPSASPPEPRWLSSPRGTRRWGHLPLAPASGGIDTTDRWVTCGGLDTPGGSAATHSTWPAVRAQSALRRSQNSRRLGSSTPRKAS